MRNKWIVTGIIMSSVSFSTMATQFVLTDSEKGMAIGNWQISSQSLNLTDTTEFSIQNKVLNGGKQVGSEVITITSGDFTIKLSPT